MNALTKALTQSYSAATSSVKGAETVISHLSSVIWGDHNNVFALQYIIIDKMKNQIANCTPSWLQHLRVASVSVPTFETELQITLQIELGHFKCKCFCEIKQLSLTSISAAAVPLSHGQHTRTRGRRMRVNCNWHLLFSCREGELTTYWKGIHWRVPCQSCHQKVGFCIPDNICWQYVKNKT